MAGLVDAFCLEMLPQAGIEFLLARCTEYNIVVPAEKQDDKNHVLKLLLHYLTNPAIDATADHGAVEVISRFGRGVEECWCSSEARAH